MSFDFVSFASSDCLKIEMSSLMDEMFLRRRNCCLVRFSTRRKFYITFLYNMLEEVDKRMGLLNACIRYVKVGYRDIRKEGEVQDVLHDQLRQYPKKRYSDRFINMRDLLVWLLKDYRLKWSDSTGHEVLEFDFFVAAVQPGLFKVNFTLFNLYLTKLDTEDRSNWFKYMEHLGEENPSDLKSSPLIASLSKHFDPGNGGRTLLLFDVPIDFCSLPDAVELLKMANAAMQGRDKQNVELLQKRALPATSSSDNSSVSYVPSNPGNLPRTVTFTIPIDKGSKQQVPPLPYSKRDLNTLSVWYRKIDDKFRMARLCLEKYYEYRYASKINEAYDDIKAITRRSDLGNQKRRVEFAAVEIKSRESALEIYDNYRAALDAFNQLNDEIACSQYAETLKVYLETRYFELSKHELSFKFKHLQSYKQRLVDALNEELCGLKSKLRKYDNCH